MSELFAQLPKQKAALIGMGLAILILFLYPQPAYGQGVEGYVKVNAFERKVTPSTVARGEKFQGLLRGDATLVKDLPLNTNVEADYVVKAKLGGGLPEEIVGKGTIKVGPLPSVKAGANVNLTENMELMFPESARPGQYTLVIETTAVRPFVIYMIIDLIFPGLQSMSMQLGQVQYLGDNKTSAANSNTSSNTPGVTIPADVNLLLNAPKEALATTNIDVDIEVQVQNVEKASLIIYLQKGSEEKSPIKNVTIPGSGRIKETIPTPDYNGNIKVVAELRDYYVGGKQVTPPAPLLKSVDVSLKRRPLQVAGKIDEKGLVKQTFQIASPDNKADIRLTSGTIALTADKQPVSEITMATDPSPPASKDSVIVGQAYNIQPEGANFEPPVRISLKYDKSLLPENVKEDELVIAYFNPVSGWVKLPGYVDKDQQTVTADVGHFSLFTILGETAKVNYWRIVAIGAIIGAIAITALFWGWQALVRH